MAVNASNFTIPVQNSNISIINTCQTRKNELCQKIRNFENKLGIKSHTELEIKDLNITPQAYAIKSSVIIPSWFLLKYDDVPQHLHIKDINDPRLNDKNYLNEMNKWINDKIQEFGLSDTCKPMDEDNLKLLILMLRDRNQFEQAKDFILAHEIAHLSHDDFKMNQIISLLIEKSFIPILICSVALFMLAPFLPWTIVAAGIGINLIFQASRICYNKFHLIPWALEDEKKADLDAKKILQTGLGGMYAFECARLSNLLKRNKAIENIIEEKENGAFEFKPPRLSFTEPIKTIKELKEWGESWSAVSFIDENGNYCLDQTHPSLTDRISYLRD